MENKREAYCIRCGRTQVYRSQGECETCGAVIVSPQVITHPADAHRPRGKSGQRQGIDPDERDMLILGVYVLACIAFLLGVFLPFVTITKQVSVMGLRVFNETNTVSMLSGIWSLLREGQWLLFFVLLLFSIVFPVLKLTILYPICCDRGDESKVKRQLKFLALTGKWSMLDVVVIGILVVTLKLGDMVEVSIRSGIYFFTASVLLTMVLSALARGGHATSPTRDGRP